MSNPIAQQQFRDTLQNNSHQICLFTTNDFVDFINTEIDKRKHYAPQQHWESGRVILEKVASNTATGTDIVLLNKLVADLGGYGAQAYVKHYGGKPHIILKGYPGLRRILNAPKYGTKNVKIVKMGLGKHGAINAAITGGVVTIILISAFRVIDFFLRDQATLTELIGTLATDVVKIGIATGASIAAATLVATSTVFGAFAIGPLVTVIAVGALTSLALNAIDDQYRITEKTIAALEDFEAFSNAKYLQGRELVIDLERWHQDKVKRIKKLPAEAVNSVLGGLLDFAEREIKRYIARSIDKLFRRMTYPSFY